MKHRHNASNAALLLSAMVLSARAWAAPPPDSIVTNTETVKFSRAASETPAGAAKLYGELRAAAARACREPGMRPSMMGSGYQDCIDAAVAKAVTDVHIDALSAMYQQDSKLPEKGVVTVAKR